MSLFYLVVFAAFVAASPTLIDLEDPIVVQKLTASGYVIENGVVIGLFQGQPNSNRVSQRFGVDGTVLTFEGCGDTVSASTLNVPGQYLFSANSLCLVDSDDGGSGNFDCNPSGSTILFFLSGSSSLLDVPAGASNACGVNTQMVF